MDEDKTIDLYVNGAQDKAIPKVIDVRKII